MALYIAQAVGKCIKKTTTNEKDNSTEETFVFTWSKSYSGQNDIFSGLTDETGDSSWFGTSTGDSIQMYQVGIQSLPGLQFTINSNIAEQGAACILGQTGIYELNLAENTPINKVTFNNIKSHLMTDTNQEISYIIIDVIYEEKTTTSEGGETTV